MKNIDPKEAAFIMEDNDRFYAIIASSPIKYDQAPDTETILTFFVVRRASGLIDIFNVMKTFKGKDCISRNVQSKLGISESKIAAELEAIKTQFTNGIRAATNFVIDWNELDLSLISDRNEQIKRIEQWNRLNVYKFPDFSLN
jgi:hypothetical protein